VSKKSLRVPLDFCGGVTCSFSFGPSFDALFTFDVDKDQE
jgi:hypothetical protein